MIYILPIEIINYILYEYLDCDDIKICYITCKLFYVLTDIQFDKIKKKWINKHVKNIFKKNSTWIDGGIFNIELEYKLLDEIKHGYFITKISSRDNFKTKIIKGKYEMGKLNGKYEINYKYFANKDFLNKFSLPLIHSVDGFLLFKDDELLHFSLSFNQKSTQKLSYFEKKLLVSILELDEVHKKQLSKKLHCKFFENFIFTPMEKIHWH
jgi:hypothetical protein